MAGYFPIDVFISHSGRDREVAQVIADRLRASGINVWFEGDPSKVEDALEQSRVLVLLMNNEEWPRLEPATLRFRDPQNKDRRFILIRVSEAPFGDPLTNLEFLDWRQQPHERLLEACRPPIGPEDTPSGFEKKITSLGHVDWVRAVAFSPDGRYALSGSSDQTVRIWEVETGRAVRVLEGHGGSVLSVAWSPDSRLALSGSDDKTVRIWEVETGRAVRVLEGHGGSVLSVTWSPDSRLALSGSDDQTVRIWEVETGRAVRVLQGHGGSVYSVAWSPDSRLALSGSDDNTVRIWEVETGRVVRVLEGHGGSVRSVAWSPDSRLALSGSADHTVRIWEVKTGRAVRVLEGRGGSVLSVSWSPDSRLALSGAADHTVRIWEVETGRAVRVLKGHGGSVLSVAWSPDSRLALSGAADHTVRTWEVETGRTVRVLEGHGGRVMSVAWSPDSRLALSGSADSTVRIWEVETGRAVRVLEGHGGSVLSVAWSQDSRLALSGSDDQMVRIWEVETGRAVRVLEGHGGSVLSVAWSPDSRLALSGSDDQTVRIWEVETGRTVRVLEGRGGGVWSVSWSPDSRLALSGSDDQTVRIWEVETGRVVRVLQGHGARVGSVAWSPDSKLALSGSDDQTVRIWEVETGRAVRVLEGHGGSVRSVAWSPDSRLALSGAADRTVRIWEVETGRAVRVLEGHGGSVRSVAWSPDSRLAFSAAINGVMRVWNVAEPEVPRSAATPAPQIQYTNAKVVLVGDSAAGKTGLSMRLASDKWSPSESTVGAWATQWKVPVTASGGVEREIWLWDFGGQADQRLIHQLYMERCALAVLVFDGQRDDIFESLGQWDRELARASRTPFLKLIVMGRKDAGGLRVSRAEVENFAAQRGFHGGLLETSAKTGQGCEELKDAILAGIDWKNIEWRTSPLLFKRLKDAIIQLKDEGRVLMRSNELRDALRLRLTGEATEFTDQELKTVVGLLAGPGVLLELEFGSWVLLEPERINAYAQAVIQTLRTDEHERGCLPEQRVLAGDLLYQSSAPRLNTEEERYVLLAMIQTLVERGVCLREHTPEGAQLIFPSYYRRERPELTGHPAVIVSYRFDGFLDDIYATLVVRLHHTNPFVQDKLWRYAADFKTLTGKQLGVKLTRRTEGSGELELYFDPRIPVEEKIIFSKYVHEHLIQRASHVIRLRHYVRPHCDAPVRDRVEAMNRFNAWLDNRVVVKTKEAPTILCVKCEKRVPLWDDMEKLFASQETQQRVREMQAESALILDNESKERALVGDVISTVALAGQIAREFNVSDHGIDMEIECKDDNGEATGEKLYLQLKSGDSYLKDRKRDGAEVFTIKERHVRYWMAQQFPVLLVVRNAEGEIRWMEVRDWLKTATNDGKKKVTQIIFEGERFDVMSVRRWRDRLLKGTN